MEQKIINALMSSSVMIDKNNIIIDVPKQANNGDFSCNIAMRMSKELECNPRNAAQKIISGIDFLEFGIEKVEIAGPGFLNFYMTERELVSNLDSICEVENIGNSETVLIDYSSPNIAKKMHIAHLRSTAIGDSLKRIYKKIGYNTIGINHIGDWGTQFGKLIVAHENWLNEEEYKKNPIDELMRIYIKFSSDATPEMEIQAREELVKVQNKDPKNYALYREFIDLSMKEYDLIYKRLDIKIEETIGESFYNDMMPDTVNELIEKEIAVVDQGAKMVFFAEEEKLHPAMVQKSDGAFGYTASDVSAVKFRTEKWKPKKILYVVDSRQKDHFKQVFAISKLMGIKTECEHISFGVMSSEAGAFSTREGNIIRLDNLLDEGYKRALAAVNEKNPNLLEEEKENIANIVSVGAIKYFDLSQNRLSDIVFTWDKALSFEGNTSSYLQYTYSRIMSIIRKSELDVTNIYKIINSEEREIIKSLKQYKNVIIESADKNSPNIIANYLFDLAQKFNSLYNKVNFLNDIENLQERINLISSVSDVLKDGLELLGIKTLGRM